MTVNDSHGTITRTYDALNRVSSYTDTYGKVIRYEYDAVGNLSKIIYPDNTAVTYAYDANHNLIRVTDWANRVTSYTYDENNRVIGVTKPDGSVTTTVYDNKQRVTSTVERTAGGVVITGFEYVYDDLSRIVEEKVLANSTKMYYTYDNLSRVTARTVKNLCDNSVISAETFSYDAAGNVTSAPDSSFQYDTNNRLISFNGNTVSYDLDGNMLSVNGEAYTYDSANRLINAGNNTYTYDAENTRIRNVCGNDVTEYTYNTNCKLSQLLMKTTNGIVTKYVYGLGLIGEEKCGVFKTYHFDYRGSTVAITDESGNITDTFKYDTYGKLTSRTGESFVIFGYNGRDGVITDRNGLIYMRARYYSPKLRRFINADIIAGDITNSITLNRYAYANGNPVSFVDPFGLTAERGGPTVLEAAYMARHIYTIYDDTQTKLIGGWQLAKILIDENGFRIGQYERLLNDGSIEYSIVNKGSSTLDDWLDNIKQPFGYSSDMKDSISYANDFVEKHPDSNITFIGHSKGGAEALANAKATNKNAIVFNPAIPNYEAYGLGNSIYTAEATSYVVTGEALSTAYLIAEGVALNPGTYVTPEKIDDIIALVSRPVFQSKPFWKTEWLKNDIWSPIEDHLMASVIEALT